MMEYKLPEKDCIRVLLDLVFLEICRSFTRIDWYLYRGLNAGEGACATT